MLKISIVDRSTQRRLVLEGALIPPWVAELKSAWKQACANRSERRIVLDFTSVTHISAEGEEALLELMQHGAKFSSGGVLTKYILQQITRKNRLMKPLQVTPESSKGEK